MHDDDDAAAQRAGGVYMAFTVLGEAFLLLGFVLLAAGEPNGSLQIRDVVAALPQSPWRDAALALQSRASRSRSGLVPAAWLDAADLHGGAHSGRGGAERRRRQGGRDRADPLPALRQRHARRRAKRWSCSGFSPPSTAWRSASRRHNPKTVLAYSSISQMGVIAAVLGMGLAAGDQSVALDTAFYAANHVLAKGALFLAVGVVAVTSARRLRPALLLAAVLALGLGGLPLTGGALAKLAVKAPLGDGVVGLLANLSAVGTSLLMLHFLQCLARTAPQDGQAAAPAGLAVPWQAMALASVVVSLAALSFRRRRLSPMPSPPARCSTRFGRFWSALRWRSPCGVGRTACRTSPQETSSAPRRRPSARSYARRRRVGARGRRSSGNGPQRACRFWRSPSYSARRPCSALERSPTAGCTSNDPLSSALRHSGCSVDLLRVGQRPAHYRNAVSERSGVRRQE